MPRPPLILGVQTMRGRFQGPIENPYLGYPEPARVGVGVVEAAVAVVELRRVVAQDVRRLHPIGWATCVSCVTPC